MATASRAKFVLNSGRDDKRLKSKGVDEVKKGDVLRIVTPGGAGYGDPMKRDVRLIAADLADGKTSEEFVMKNYGKDKLFEAKRHLAGTHRAAAE